MPPLGTGDSLEAKGTFFLAEASESSSSSRRSSASSAPGSCLKYAEYGGSFDAEGGDELDEAVSFRVLRGLAAALILWIGRSLSASDSPSSSSSTGEI